jgi:CheY-like chemotaxis protein
MVSERSPSPPSSTDRGHGGTAQRSVLVLEDDRDVALSIKEVVEEEGYRAICVGNGREALAILEEELPCFMLIDVFMPIMNGVEFLKVVRSNPRLAKIPRVIMTAANDRMIGVKEDISVIYKPVDFDALKRLLHKYCEPANARPR